MISERIPFLCGEGRRALGKGWMNLCMRGEELSVTETESIEFDYSLYE